MKRLMIQADERLLKQVRRRASDRGVSIAQVVRDALERDLGSESPPPTLTSIGEVSSDLGDLSRRSTAGEFEPEPYR